MRSRNRLVQSVLTGALVATGVGGGVGSASAQLMTVTGQERFMEGSTHSVNPDGSMFDQGPTRVEAPVGVFGTWTDLVNVGGHISVNGAQDGGWDGTNTITLSAYSMSLGGGGPPMSSGTATLANVFAFTFDITANATYTLSTSVGCGLDVVLRLQLTGPGDTIDVTAIPNGPLVELVNMTGNLAPGSYTLRLSGTSTISYDGGTTGGGNGSGAGGAQPNLTFVVAPRPCAADFNNSGGVSVQDIFDFLAAYFSNDSRADVNNSGGITVQDIFDFLALYFAGCS